MHDPLPSECDEATGNMAKTAPQFASYDDALAWVKEWMPDESYTVRSNVAEALFDRQPGPDEIPHAPA